MKKLFAYEGWYYKTFTFLANLMILNFLFLLTSLTIFLTLPALVAFYQTMYRLYTERDIVVFKTFKKNVQKNLKPGYILLGLFAVFLGAVGSLTYGLFEMSSYFSILAIILITLSLLYGNAFVVLYSLYPKSVTQSAHEAGYLLLSSTANAILLLVIPAALFILFMKINPFLFVAVGFASIVYLQVVFFYKYLEDRDGKIEEVS